MLRRVCDITDLSLRKRKCRVIVRNLSFLATEVNVADKLGKFGPLVEVIYQYDQYTFCIYSLKTPSQHNLSTYTLNALSNAATWNSYFESTLIIPPT